MSIKAKRLAQFKRGVSLLYSCILHVSQIAYSIKV